MIIYNVTSIEKNILNKIASDYVINNNIECLTTNEAIEIFIKDKFDAEYNRLTKHQIGQPGYFGTIYFKNENHLTMFLLSL